MSRPDAVLMPGELKKGKRSSDRIQSVLDIAEPILQVDRSKGELGWLRYLAPPYPPGTPQFVDPSDPTGRRQVILVMVTRDRDAGRDTLLYHKTHDQAGEHRYSWSPITAQGVSIGTCTDPDAVAPVAPTATVAAPVAVPVAPAVPTSGVTPNAAPAA
jgi:hypothetical protein